MAKNKKPTKKYVPKPIRPPVTKGLFDEFGKDMHFSLMSFMAGTASVERWKKLAKVVMTVSFATDNEPRVSKAHKVAIDSAVLTLKAISDMNVRTGKWRVSDLDYLSLSRGVTAVDAVLPHLDYRKLKHGYLTFVRLVHHIKEESCS